MVTLMEKGAESTKERKRERERNTGISPSGLMLPSANIRRKRKTSKEEAGNKGPETLIDKGLRMGTRLVGTVQDCRLGEIRIIAGEPCFYLY